MPETIVSQQQGASARQIGHGSLAASREQHRARRHASHCATAGVMRIQPLFMEMICARTTVAQALAVPRWFDEGSFCSALSHRSSGSRTRRPQVSKLEDKQPPTTPFGTIPARCNCERAIDRKYVGTARFQHTTQKHAIQCQPPPHALRMGDDCTGDLHQEKPLQFTRGFCAEHRIRTAAKLQIRKRIGATIASGYMLWTPSAAPLSLRCPCGPA